MEIQIGKTISELRRKKGLTQEQLANAVGVSTPAVSKWETSTSYPDIALLAPIARTLGTNVDTLLNFNPKLTDEQAAALVSEVVSVSTNEGANVALERMKEILHTYPENPALQFHMASVLCGFNVKSEPEKAANRQLAKKLFESVIESGDAQLFSSAVFLLAGLCLEDNELDLAEQLLARIPDPLPDTQLLKASIYEKRGDLKQAKQIVQACLYLAFQRAEMCLGRLVKKEFSPDTATALLICEIHKELAAIMHYPYAMSDQLFANVYLRDNHSDLAADHLLKLASSLSREVKPWGNTLFSELDMNTETMDAMLQHIRKTTCDNLLTNDIYKPLQHNIKFLEAVKTLQRQK